MSLTLLLSSVNIYAVSFWDISSPGSAQLRSTSPGSRRGRGCRTTGGHAFTPVAHGGAQANKRGRPTLATRRAGLMRHTCPILVAAVLMASMAPKTSAEFITIVFEAEVTSVDDLSDFLDGAVSIGDTISGVYTFEAGTPDSEPDDPVVGQYDEAVTDLTGLVAGVGFVSLGPLDVTIADQDGPAISQDDAYYVTGDIVMLAKTLEFALQIRYDTFDVFSSDALPSEAPPLEPSVFALVKIFSEQEFGLAVVGELRSLRLIPEPATLGLLTLGALAVRGAARPRPYWRSCNHTGK